MTPCASLLSRLKVSRTQSYRASNILYAPGVPPNRAGPGVAAVSFAFSLNSKTQAENINSSFPQLETKESLRLTYSFQFASSPAVSLLTAVKSMSSAHARGVCTQARQLAIFATVGRDAHSVEDHFILLPLQVSRGSFPSLTLFEAAGGASSALMDD